MEIHLSTRQDLANSRGALPVNVAAVIGKRLLVETVAAADAEKFLRIELSVHSDNLRAISLYRDFGFVEEGRKIKARLKSSVPVDVLLMARLRPEGEWPPN